MKSKKQKVVILRGIPENAVTMLQKQFVVDVNKSGHVLTRAQLLRRVKGASAIISLLTDRIDDEVLDAAGDSLKIVANYAVGFDNIDLGACEVRGVVATNTPGQLTDSVAEHSMALLLAAARRICEGDTYIRNGKYVQWEPMLLWGQTLLGQTIGIVGGGRIGAAFGMMCHNAFRMRVVYSDVAPCTHLEREAGAKRVSLNELLERSDVVSVHCPLLPTTHHLLGAAEFSKMKSSAILINTARGPIVDERALVTALKKGKLFGAGLDVFEFEPALVAGLKQCDRVVLTPHIGSATRGAREMMASMAAANVAAVLQGRSAPNPVTKYADPCRSLDK